MKKNGEKKEIFFIFVLVVIYLVILQIVGKSLLGINDNTKVVMIIRAIIAIIAATYTIYRLYGNLKSKIIFAGFLLIFALISIIPSYNNTDSNVQTVVADTNKQQSIDTKKNINEEYHKISNEPIKEESSLLTKIQKSTNLDGKDAQKVKDILEKCGLTDIKKIVRDKEMLDDNYDKGSSGYRITNGHINNIILYILPNNSVYRVRFADHDLYINNKVNHVIQDFPDWY